MTEVQPPHLQRTAVRHPKLHHHDALAAEAREVSVVDVEVVDPLVNQALGVLAEVPLQRVAHGGQTAGNGGSELLIFVPRAAHGHDAARDWSTHAHGHP